MTTPASPTSKPLLSVPIKYAVVGGVLNIALFLVLLLFDQNPLVTDKIFKLLFDLFILGIFIFFCIKEFKVYHNQGSLRFWQGMTLGFFTLVYMASITGAFLLVYLSLNPGMMQDYVAQQTALLNSNQENIVAAYGERTYQQWLADLKLVTTADFVIEDFMTKFGLGFFASLLISVAMRSAPIPEATTTDRSS